jgi:hypothetical protein
MSSPSEVAAHDEPLLFPAFSRFVESTQLVARAKGALSAQIPRILGQGQTRAEGLSFAPAPIERKLELVRTKLPEGFDPPSEVRTEIDQVHREVDEVRRIMRTAEGQRQLATRVLNRLEESNKGFKDNQFFAGRLVLVPDKSGLNWAWSLTRYYPMIAKIPPDIDYIVRAYEVAERKVESCLLDPEDFARRLSLAWAIAYHFSRSEDVLIVDVMRMFRIAGQDNRFWSTLTRVNFRDVPDAVFIANLLRWRRNPTSAGPQFELVPATLDQALGPQAKPFFIPSNAEGTQTRPWIFMRRASRTSNGSH